MEREKFRQTTPQSLVPRASSPDKWSLCMSALCAYQNSAFCTLHFALKKRSALANRFFINFCQHREPSPVLSLYVMVPCVMLSFLPCLSHCLPYVFYFLSFFVYLFCTNNRQKCKNQYTKHYSNRFKRRF